MKWRDAPRGPVPPGALNAEEKMATLKEEGDRGGGEWQRTRKGKCLLTMCDRSEAKLST